MRLKYKPSDKPHPLEGVVLKMAEAGKIVDVSSVSVALAGGVFFGQPKGNRAYRIVAADVLGYMADQGKLEMHGCFEHKPEDGGPFFTLPKAEGRVKQMGVKTCGTCKHRESGYCESEKLGEDWGQSDNEPGAEGDYERGGCVHHAAIPITDGAQ